MFLAKVEADTVDVRGEVILFLRKVFGGTPEVVAGFPRASLLSFIVDDPGKALVRGTVRG